ncbi:Uma2 family endonuclease [Methylomagnum sp.]
MSVPAQKIATYEDLRQVPDHLIAEIIHGQLITMPRPSPKHARAASIMGGKLVPPYDEGSGGPGGWWILFEPELHLGPGPEIMVPDLAGWRRERLPTLPETAYFEQAPDWVLEVLSPSTARKDRAVKLPVYGEFGVGHVWLVDPDVRTLEVFSLREGFWRLEHVYQEADEVSAPPFEAMRFSLAGLWP